ncbi:MAG: tetratricopeptide repeat protein, partial [Candidatus Eisenbacteria bacterium]|nr:tetratricopeptide repeat protein [Candidatus Eisenbacteria bacterium]
MSTVVSAFMGGLALGSFVLGRYIDRRPRPLITVYAYLEAGIGIFGLLFPLILGLIAPIYSHLYAGVSGNIVLLNLLRFLICFLLILIPTFLMGGTLPVLIKRFTGPGRTLGHETGFLYGLNTLGAVLGTAASGFFLLRLLGMQMTTLVAVAVNLGVAVVAWFLGRSAVERRMTSPQEPLPPRSDAPQQLYSTAVVRMVLAGIGLSGFCALAYEVFWTRMLNLFLHNNVYSFTAILTTFLVGISVGSLIYARFLSGKLNQLRIFIALQFAIGILAYSTPLVFSTLHGLFNNFNESLTLAKTSLIMLAPTVLMGIAVPLAVQICQRGPQREGTSVGSVYAINTMGAILGGFAAGFLLLPSVGLYTGIIIVASLNLLAGFLPLTSILRPRLRPALVLALAVLIAALSLAAPPDLFRGLFQRAHPNADIVYYKEGRAANILVYDFKKLGYKDFHLNAVNEASSRLWHVQLFKLLGLLPTVLHDDPTDALMVAFGAGMSAGACARNVDSLYCVDLNPDIEGVAAAYTRENLDVINQPNFRRIVNDGRNTLFLSPRKYSLIISDATNPKMFDSWTLYSQEFYELVKKRLEPGGIFCQWAVIPLPHDSIKTILNTFRSVFPHMSVWVIHGSSQMLMLGTPERLEIDYATLKERLDSLWEVTGLRDYGVHSVEKFLSFFLVGEDGLNRMLDGFDKISTDDLPYAQFYIEQDRAGLDHCLDLVRYQESISRYMINKNSAPADFEETMRAYAEIAYRLNVGFLTGDRTRYAEAAVTAADAGLDDANIAHLLHHCPVKKRYFKERLKEHPRDVNAINTLGSIYLEDGDYEAALREFTTAVALRPDYAFARANLAKVHMALGQFEAAVAEIMEVRDLCPTRGILRTTSRQLAKVRIRRRLRYQEDSAQLFRSLAIAEYNEGHLLEAVTAYRRAVELSNSDPGILYNLARIYERHEFLEDAADAYARLSELHPEAHQIFAKSIELGETSKDPGQRRRWMNASIEVPHLEEMDDEHPPTCDEALRLWEDIDPEGTIERSKLQRAAELYEQSIATQPADLHAYIDAATLYEVLGDYGRAARLWSEASQLNPDLQIAQRHIARLEVLGKLEHGTSPSRDRASLLTEAGRHWRATGEPEQALVYLRKAVALAPDDPEAWEALADAATDAGLYEEAMDAAAKGLELHPGRSRSEMILETLSDFVSTESR